MTSTSPTRTRTPATRTDFRPAPDQRRGTSTRPRENPAVTAEKSRSRHARTRQWLCPGPEWPPNDETCGRMLNHKGRCQECSITRMKLRKAEQRHNAKLARTAAANQNPEFALPSM